jgi:type II secretory ATPase GspE/PulE/Tfp pilus assembly ATPase PilB-like protein
MKQTPRHPHELALIDFVAHAHHLGASDVHIEPRREGVEVRLRIHGALSPLVNLDQGAKELFLEKAKALLGFNMSQAGVPQDASWEHPHEAVDCRANLIPIRHGEKICLRLLQRDKDFSLNTYPLPKDVKTLLYRLIEKRSGLMIVSGPTGSGKSTLLYSILGSLDRNRLNICTIEDPIEYSLAGINQSPILRRKGFDFASALRALMRQDPDVIMVGEIRDHETAEAAVHAASTGHLVLTTVHANSSKEILTRLEGLGIARGLLDGCLLFASAQRLPRTQCPFCLSEEVNVDQVLLAHLIPEKAAKLDFTPMIASGCSKCHDSGVSGRTLLFEYLAKEDSLGLVQHGSLQASAWQAVTQGQISVREAYAQFH